MRISHLISPVTSLTYITYPHFCSPNLRLTVLIRKEQEVHRDTNDRYASDGYTSASIDTTWISWDDFRPLKALHVLLYQLPIPDMNRLTACFPHPPTPANQRCVEEA